MSAGEIVGAVVITLAVIFVIIFADGGPRNR